MPHALLVDDDSDAAETMAMLIANEGFTVATAGSLRDARRQIALQEPDIVLLDLMLPDGSGMELFNDAEAARQHRAGADHRPRQPRDVDPGAAPRRRRLPRQADEPEAAAGRAVARDASLRR